ncbi:MAG: hypothetical protein LC107_07275 [Chitinophagales bacterium]|nr:hypothetical protein [Chitinophagales bacterium]
MMKCKFFSALVIVLLMFVGVSMSAQDYVPNAEAQTRVNSELTSLLNASSSVNIKALHDAGPAAMQGEVEKSLKIQYAKELLTSLKKGSATGVAVDEAGSSLANVSNESSFQDALNKAILYFKDLLK